MNTTHQWFALVTHPRGELRADEELAEAGIEHFTPTFKRSCAARHTTPRFREREVIIPLLSGYTFARLDFSPRSHHPSLLGDCKHIVGPIKICGAPVPVRSAELRQLRLLCDAGAFDQGRLRGSDRRFKDGDPVMFIGGALVTHRGVFRETADGVRPRAGFVRVMLDKLFGARMSIDVPQDFIEAA